MLALSSDSFRLVSNSVIVEPLLYDAVAENEAGQSGDRSSHRNASQNVYGAPLNSI